MSKLLDEETLKRLEVLRRINDTPRALRHLIPRNVSDDALLAWFKGHDRMRAGAQNHALIPDYSDGK